MTDQTDINPFRPRRLRIAEPGWEGFTGDFGTVAFEGGVSVDPVPWKEQQRLGGIIRIESAEGIEGAAQLGPAAELIRARGIDADHPRVEGASTGAADASGEVKLAAASFSREELEAIADRDGIHGLRTIAQGWGVRGRAINELINEILDAQERALAGEPPARVEE